jgi:hypothetical protein
VFSKGVFSKGVFSKGVFSKGVFSKGVASSKALSNALGPDVDGCVFCQSMVVLSGFP